MRKIHTMALAAALVLGTGSLALAQSGSSGSTASSRDCRNCCPTWSRSDLRMDWERPIRH